MSVVFWCGRCQTSKISAPGTTDAHTSRRTRSASASTLENEWGCSIFAREQDRRLHPPALDRASVTLRIRLNVVRTVSGERGRPGLHLGSLVRHFLLLLFIVLGGATCLLAAMLYQCTPAIQQNTLPTRARRTFEIRRTHGVRDMSFVLGKIVRHHWHRGLVSACTPNRAPPASLYVTSQPRLCCAHITIVLRTESTERESIRDTPPQPYPSLRSKHSASADTSMAFNLRIETNMNRCRACIIIRASAEECLLIATREETRRLPQLHRPFCFHQLKIDSHRRRYTILDSRSFATTASLGAICRHQRETYPRHAAVSKIRPWRSCTAARGRVLPSSHVARAVVH
jgi:hypothetical protein